MKENPKCSRPKRARRFVCVLVVTFLVASSLSASTIADSGPVHLETTVDAPVAEVWKAWTTEEGLRSFLAPEVNMRLEVGGPFEVYFDPTVPEGSRGSEGSIILAFEEESMLSFTWNAPPSMPEIRKQRTHVTVRFYSLGEKQTRVTLDHDGWGRSAEWMNTRAYFDKAWGTFVLPSLQKRFSPDARN